MPVIGFLHIGSAATFGDLVSAFRKGLSETGYVEGQSVAIEYRWAEGQNERLPELAAELIRRRVAVIVTPGSTPATFAAKAATTTIPIVFIIAADPMKIGLVASLNRPGGNLTGISDIGGELGAKRLGLLHELLPGAARFAVLVNPDNPFITEAFVAELRAAASVIGRQIEVVTARTNSDIDAAFATLVNKGADAILVSPDTLFLTRRVQLVTLAARHALPAMYHRREFAEARLARCGRRKRVRRRCGIRVRCISDLRAADHPELGNRCRRDVAPMRCTPNKSGGFGVMNAGRGYCLILRPRDKLAQADLVLREFLDHIRL